MARTAVALMAATLTVAGCGYSEDVVPATVLLPGQQVSELWCYRTLGPPECFMAPQPGEEGRLLVISFADVGDVAF
ncbi:MAG: hypothetical protein ACFCVH_21810 [Alphaproteobacteria bacterium]